MKAKTNAAKLKGKPKYKVLIESYVFKVERNIFSNLIIKSSDLANIPYGLYFISVTTFKECMVLSVQYS